MADVKRIGVGNNKYLTIDTVLYVVIPPHFTFDSTIVKMDSTTKKMDEQ